ncbi:protein of unknown function (plasmid) [Caballeronia sp. S22]
MCLSQPAKESAWREGLVLQSRSAPADIILIYKPAKELLSHSVSGGLRFSCYASTPSADGVVVSLHREFRSIR